MKHYEPSGGARATLFAFFGLALVAAVPIAIVYQLLVEYVPFIQLNVLLAFVLGLALGGLARLAIRHGHCRSPVLGYVLTGVVGLAGLAATWATLYARIVQRVAGDTGVPFAEARAALAFAEVVALRMQSGWSISGHGSSPDAFTGTWVALVWGCEALIVLVCAILGVVPELRRAYCERCAAWCKAIGFGIPGVTRADVEPRLGDLSSVVATSAKPSDGTSSVALDGELCDRCATAYLSLTEITTKVVRNRTHVKKQRFARQLVLDDRARAGVRRAGCADKKRAATRR